MRIVAGPELDTDNMALVQRWIERNRDTLVAYWDGELLTDEVIARLVPAT